MSRLSVIALCLLAALAAPAEPAAGQGGRAVVVVGGDRDYPPYEFLDKSGQPAGFNVEITRAVAEVMGLQVDIRLGDWNEMRRSLEAGSVDVLEGISLSPDRARMFECSEPHCMVRQSIFARRGSPRAASLEDLGGRDVIVQRGGVMHDTLASRGIPARLVLVDTHAAGLRLLASGRSDYAVVNTLTGLYFGLELGLSNIVPVSEPVAEIPYGYAARKGNGALIAQLDQGLGILRNTGRYQQIYDKWLGILEARPSPWHKILKYGAMVLLPILALAAGMSAWSWSLRKRIGAYIRDSELRQQELIQADKMASLGILVSGVAHEINNPTGLILYDLPILRSAYRLAEDSLERRYEEKGDFLIGGLKYSEFREEVPRMFEEMQGGARRIKRIVDDLKDFARKDTSGFTEVVDLNVVVQAALRLVDNSIRKATARFEAEYGTGMPPFKGNAQRIEQVVVNLVLNACQALERPEQGIRLRTAFDAQRRALLCTVADDGVGIPPENLSRLTDPFFTTKRELGGTGLGLSISAGIVKDHRGSLEFTSAPGEGTQVVLALPALEGA